MRGNALACGERFDLRREIKVQRRGPLEPRRAHSAPGHACKTRATFTHRNGLILISFNYIT